MTLRKSTDDSLPSLNFWRQLKSDADRGKSVIKGVPAVMMLRGLKSRLCPFCYCNLLYTAILSYLKFIVSISLRKIIFTILPND